MYRLCKINSFLLFAIFCLVSSSWAQIPAAATGLTVDAALNVAADRVDSSVQKAGAVANGVVIRAGSEVNAEIGNFRAAYKDMLDKTVSSLNSTATAQLSQIFSDANSLERQTAADATRVVQLGQQVANTFPIANKKPQITLIDPTYEVYAPARTDDIPLTVEGNFVDAADKNYTPWIEVGAKHISPVHITTQHLLFMIPRGVLAPNGHPTSFVKLPIVIPYKEGLLFKSRRESKFFALIVGLPESPGKISLEIRTTVSTSRTDHIRAPQDNMQSDRDDHEEVRCGPNESDPINPNSAKVVFEHTEGSSWTYHPVRLNNPSVCFWFRTEHHGIGTSDKLWWHYEYDVTRADTLKNTSTQTISLKWGESQVFLVTAGNFTVRFDSFDGSHQEYLAQNHNNRYIDISTEGAGLRLAVRPVTGILPLDEPAAVAQGQLFPGTNKP